MFYLKRIVNLPSQWRGRVHIRSRWQVNAAHSARQGQRRRCGINIRILTYSVFAWWSTAGSAWALDCQRAYTTVEKTICGDPDLRRLEREFVRLSAEVQQQGARSEHALGRMRDGFARRCRHSSKPIACLQRQHLAGMAELEAVLKARARPPRMAAAKAEPEVDAEIYHEHGELAMLEVYRRQMRADANVPPAQKISQLQKLVVAACRLDADPRDRQRLAWYGLNCQTR